MEQALEEFMDYLLGIAIALLCIPFIVYILSVGSDYNKAVVDKMGDKSSIDYSIAYGTEDYYLSADNVYADIVQEMPGITIQINGNTLNAEALEKVKNHNQHAISSLKNVLGNASYKKVLIYDKTGNITRINYIGAK